MLDCEFEGFQIVNFATNPQVHPLIRIFKVVLNVIQRVLHGWVVTCFVQNEFLLVTSDIAKNTVLFIDRPSFEEP